MANIVEKGYAKFREETLAGMVQLPVEGICVITKLEGGSLFVNYYNSTVMDKVAYAGMIQQDAMIETLRANRWIPNGETADE